MKRPLRAAFACGLVAVIAIACSKRPSSATLIPTPGAQSAAVYAVVNRVEARASAAAKLAPVANGYVLGVGSQLQTGEAASARLDFADDSFVRLTEKSSLTLQAVNTDARPLKRLQLEIGTLWVSLASGTLEVETPVGSVSVRGSFAVIRYAPGDPANPDDDLLVVDCLEGTCAVQNDTRDIQMGNMERAVVNQQGQLRMVLTGADVEAFLKQNPETRGLVETLTAAPPATDTPSPTGTPTSPPATATYTLTPVSTATPIRLATSATVTPSPTVAAVKPTATLAAAILGRHIVRAGETLFCIARVYGVAPDAIAQVNGLAAPDFLVTTGQTLKIPSVRWTAVIPGPACTPQFNSPFNPLPTTPPATRTPTPTGSITPAPTATCEPGHFYDPFQKRCRPPDTPAPLITNTPINTP
ncbi:MAG: LysM protein, partial [Anaerolineales bacterium]|nr:LysM protein [Anaerolineales bacterium]